jgi:hypothetical protein
VGQINLPQDLIDRIKLLERQVKDLGRGRPRDGSILWDANGQALIGADTATGHGLASPYIPVSLGVGSVVLPTATTTSATFDVLAIGRYRPQNPRLWAYVLCRSSDGSTTGEIKVTVAGVDLDAPQTIAAAEYGYHEFGPTVLPIPYVHGVAVDVEVKARRTAGAGTIGARVISVYGQ